MQNKWLFFSNIDIDTGCQHGLPTEFHLSHGFGAHILSQIGSLVDRSLYRSNHLYSSGSLVLQGAFNCIIKFAGTFFIWLSTESKNSNILRKLASNASGPNPTNYTNVGGMQFCFGSNNDNLFKLFDRFPNTSIKSLWKEIEQHQILPILSLALPFVSPFHNLSSEVLSSSIPLGHIDEQINGPSDKSLPEYNNRGCSRLAISKITIKQDATEQNTGIKFPTSLYCPSGGEDTNTEVLVGTGSRSMTIIRVKSLKIYAFGLYVHPDSICEKLGPKYASIPTCELENCSDFYDDLLRGDIHMTVRLVVNCNGLKVNRVKDAFEKSLRNRLQKMNPSTDYQCLRVFGSCFTTDIPLPVGTIIDFRQTADGQLITEIGGKQIGSVHSKDLCRAFFDMYIGDGPVSVQAKQQLAQNIAGFIRRC